MAKFRALINTFTGGEVSPRVQVRSDTQKYAQCCKRLQNMLAHPVGGVYRRPGTQFVAEVTGGVVSDLFPFVYSKSEAYAIWMGYHQIEGLKLGAFHTLSSITVTGDQCPYSFDKLHEIQYCQSADVLYLTHPDYKPNKLSRTSDSNFTFRSFDYGLSGQGLVDAYPYRNLNTSAITLDPSNTSGSVTITASASFFDSKHVGAIFKFKGNGGSTWGAYQITAITSDTLASATTLVSPDSHTASTSWAESAWSDYRGWPRSVAFFEDRLGYFGNLAQPDSGWFSMTANYALMNNWLHFDGTTGTITERAPNVSPTGADPFVFTLLSQQLNEIQWVCPGKKLVIGTSGNEYLISTADSGSAFGAANITAVSETAYGSVYSAAVRVGSSILFVDRTGSNIREFVFEFQQDSFTADSLSIHADHLISNEFIFTPVSIVKNGIRRMAWDSYRNTMWVASGSGEFFGLTRERGSEVAAWHRHPIGGTNVSVRSHIVLPNAYYGRDDVFVLLSRYVNGALKYYVERIGQNFGIRTTTYPEYGYCDFGLAYGPVFVDCAAAASSALPAVPETTFSGFDHLVGEQVVGLADGHFFDDVTVSLTGEITLPFEASFVIAGLPNVPILEPVSPEAGSQVGTAQGATRRAHTAWVKFEDTVRARIGCDANHLESPVFRAPSVAEDLPTPLFTGVKKIPFPGSYDAELSVYVTSDQPYPLNVTAVILEGLTYD